MQSQQKQQHKPTGTLQKLDLRLIGAEYGKYQQSPQLYLLQRLSDGNPWPQKSQLQIHAFLKNITALYNAVPYHNLTHAFDVMIHMDIYLVQYGWQQRLQISQQKRLVMLIAAYAHDVGHQGLTNAYYKNSNHPLAIASSSPLQNMHVSNLRRLLREHELEIEARLLEQLTEMILKTDNFYHGWLVEGARALKGCSEIELREPKNTQIVNCLLLHAADLNNTAKQTSVSVLWTNLLYEQFQNQDRLEKEKGLNLTCNTFSTFGERIESNISFFDHLVFPLFRNIADIQPKFLALTVQAEKNKAYWQSLIDKYQNK